MSFWTAIVAIVAIATIAAASNSRDWPARALATLPLGASAADAPLTIRSHARLRCRACLSRLSPRRASSFATAALTDASACGDALARAR